MKNKIIFFFLFLFLTASAQVKLPLEVNNYDSVTSHSQLMNFIDEIKSSPKIKTEVIGKSAGGYEITARLNFEWSIRQR